MNGLSSLNNGDWTFHKPVEGRDEMGRILALISQLTDLKGDRRVTDPTELAKARATFDKPFAEFVLSDSQGKPLASLVIGGEAGMARRYVKGLNDDVYVADTAFARDWKSYIDALKPAAGGSGVPAATSSGAPAARSSAAPSGAPVGASSGVPAASFSPVPLPAK